MLTLKNEALQVLVDPEHGGRIVSSVELRGGAGFVCYDSRRLPVDPSLGYDGNFAGGFDELRPFCSFEEIRCSIGELKRFARMKLYRVAFLSRKPD